MRKFTRRDFVKLGLATAGYLAMASPFERWLHADDGELLPKGVSPLTGKPYATIPTTCGMCEAGCGILAFTEGKRIVTLQGNPLHPNNQGKICAKGIAGINLFYDPERLVFPIKRAGKRGEGKWKRITWDDAYEEIAKRLKKKGESRRDQEFVLEAGPVALDGLSRMASQLLGISILIDDTAWREANRHTAHQLTWGEGEGVADPSGSHYILNFGANPFENGPSYINLGQRIIKAKMECRAKMVTFDVRLSNTAGKSDEWFPINPGTDGVVALSMAHVIMERGLADQEFLDRWTTFPSEKVRAYLSSYDTQRAEEISGIKAADIERIAIELATNKPATIISGGGIIGHRNGVHNERCLLLLNAVVGSIDTPGGWCVPRTYPLDTLMPNFHQKNEKCEMYPELESLFSAKRKIGIYMTYGANPVYSHPVMKNDLQKVLKDESQIPFFVAVDTHISETAALADIVLPASTYLESWGLTSRPSFEMVPYLSILQPVSAPLGESLPFSEICIRLAGKVEGGGEPGFSFSGTEEMVKKVVSKIKGLGEAGGIDYLKQKGVWFDTKERPRYLSYQHTGFKTPSGKFEIYSDTLKAKGENPLPVYQPLSESVRLSDKEFILIRYESNVHSPFTANAKWSHEILHDNPLWINAESADAINIKDGDLVIVRSLVGAITCKARLSQGIHPKVVALAANVGHWGYGHIAQAQLFKSADPDSNLVWWQKEGKGINVNTLIPLDLDPLGKGQAWMDTTVTLGFPDKNRSQGNSA